MPRAGARQRLAILLSSTGGLISSSASAATIDWINPAGGTFQDGANWSGGVVPGASDRPRFGIVGTPMSITFNAGVINDRLTVASGADAIGFGETSALGITQFFGVPVDATTLVMRYTRAGDANLDGIVNVS